MRRRFDSEYLQPSSPLSIWQDGFEEYLSAWPTERSETAADSPYIDFDLPSTATATPRVQAILAGFLYVDTDAKTISLHVTDFGSKLKDDAAVANFMTPTIEGAVYSNFRDIPVNCGGIGHTDFHEIDAKLPWPLAASYGELSNQTQLMPLPARVHYLFDEAYNDFANDVSSFLTSYLHQLVYAVSQPNQVAPWDELYNQERLEELEGIGFFRPDPHKFGTRGLSVNSSSISSLVAQVLSEPLGLYVDAGVPLCKLLPGHRLRMRAEDYRNYGLFDQPLAIFKSPLQADQLADFAVLPPGCYDPSSNTCLLSSQELQSFIANTTVDVEPDSATANTSNPEYYALVANNHNACLDNYSHVVFHYTDSNSQSQFLAVDQNGSPALTHVKKQLRYGCDSRFSHRRS